MYFPVQDEIADGGQFAHILDYERERVRRHRETLNRRLAGIRG